MNSPVFCVLAAVCFATGWWIDGLGELGKPSPASERKQIARIPAVPLASLPGALTADFSAPSDPGTARTLEDFQKLLSPTGYTASRAKVERALNNMNTAEFAALAGELMALTGTKANLSGYPYQFVNALILHWMPVDPGPALAFTVDFPGALNHETAYPFLDGVGKFYKTDALATANLLGRVNSEIFFDARIQCFESLKGTPPDEALRTIVDFDIKARAEVYAAGYLGDFPKQWIEKDPSAAMNWALSLPPTHTKQCILDRMGTAWGKADAEAARAFVEALPRSILPTGELRNNLLKGIHRGDKP